MKGSSVAFAGLECDWEQSVNDREGDSGIASLQPLKKTVLSEETFSKLRAAILNGSIEQGTRIVEETLARQLGISRAPLREALWLLKRDGLLREESARDTRVVSLNEADIRELHLIRTVLETLAYQHAAPLLTPEEISGLENLVDRMQRAGENSESQVLANLDYEFHQRLCRASGLPRVYRIWEEQHILFRLWLNVVARAHDGDIEEIVSSHRALLAAIAGKDDLSIAEQTRRHVYFAGSALADKRARWAEEHQRVSIY